MKLGKVVPEDNRPKRASLIIVIIGILLFSLLTLPRLGQQLLWEDEAHRALLGINTLRFGYPTAWDGEKFIAQFGFAEISKKYFSDKYLSGISGWFPYYIFALIFKIFGVSTLTARLPFWFFGLLSISIIYFYRDLVSKNKQVLFVLLSLILFITNVTFLVYTRQASYYTPAIFFILLSSLFFLKHITGKISSKKLFSLLLVNHLLIHINILSFVAIHFAQAPFLFLKGVKNKSSGFIKIIIYYLVSIVVSYPWYLFYSSVRSPTATNWYRNLVLYISQINFYFIPLILLLLGISFFPLLLNRTKNKNFIIYILILTFIHLALATFATSGYPHYRYISSLMGVWTIFIVVMLICLPWWLGFIALLLIISIHFNIYLVKYSQLLITNLMYNEGQKKDAEFKFLITRQKDCYFCEYLKELRYDYEGPMDPIIKELNELDVRNKKISVGWCNYNMVMFYTGGVVFDNIPKEKYLVLKGHSWDISDADYIVNMSICSNGYTQEFMDDRGYQLIARLPMASLIHHNREDLVYRSFVSPPKTGIAFIYKKITSE